MQNTKLHKKIKKLILLAKSGDADSFGDIFDLLADDIYRFIFFKIGHKMDAQDITAEVFKRSWVRLKYINADNFRAYLYKIARNLIIDKARKEKKDPCFYTQTDIVDERVGIEKVIEKKQQISKVHKALDELKKRHKEVIICRFIEELSVKETAKVLSISVINVRVIQFRAIRKLRKLLKKQNG